MQFVYLWGSPWQFSNVDHMYNEVKDLVEGLGTNLRNLLYELNAGKTMQLREARAMETCIEQVSTGGQPKHIVKPGFHIVVSDGDASQS